MLAFNLTHFHDTALLLLCTLIACNKFDCRLLFSNIFVLTAHSSVVAVNEITNHKVAIKILNKRKIKLQGVFEKVKREIKVLRRFNHPHIIKHFEFIDTSSDIFIVLEYAEKGELFDLIQRKEKVNLAF